MNQSTVKRSTYDKRTAVNMICTVATHGISALIALVLTPYLISTLGFEAYGFYPLALELLAGFSLVSGLLGATATRYITIEEAGGRTESANRYVSTVFFGNLILSGLLALPMAGVVIFCDRLFDIPAELLGQVRIFFLLMLASVLVDGIFFVFSSAYSVSGRLDLSAGERLLGILVKAGVLGCLLGVLPPSVISVGVAVFASSFAMGLLSLIMARCLWPRMAVSARAFSLSALGQVSVSGFLYSFLRFGSFLLTGAFLFMVNRLFGAHTGGVYSVALTVSRVLSGVLLVCAGVYVPVMEKGFAVGDREELLGTVKRGQKLLGFFALVGVSVCVSFCGDFFSLWLGDQNTPTLRLLCVLLVLPALSVATALPILNLSLVMNRMRRVSFLFVGGALLSLALAIALRAFFGCDILVMAAVSAGAQILWYAGFMPLFGAHLLGMSPVTFLLPVLRLHGGAAVSVGLLWVARTVFAVDSWEKLAVMFVICFLCVCSVGYLTLFARPKAKR